MGHTELRPIRLVEVDVEEVTVVGGDIARMMCVHEDMSEVRLVVQRPAELRDQVMATMEHGSNYNGMTLHMRRTRNPAAPLGRALIIHDSFGAALMPYLGHHFQDALWLPTQRKPIAADVIESQQPDIVIEIHVERMLMTGVIPLLRDEPSGR